MRLLVVRLGAMGDIIHTLPAVASLKAGNHITWAVETRWLPLLAGNPTIDDVLPVERGTLGGYVRTWRALSRRHFDAAVDFQGLWKSALVSFASGAATVYGFDSSVAREPSAAVLYTHTCLPACVHVVDRALELAVAAGAKNAERVFPIPAGEPEGSLPAVPFVLANPLAGWGSKQWPFEYFEELGALLRGAGYELVLNAPKAIEARAHVHVSGLPGLIDATRRAVAVVGLDSGPLHLAAALGKPGVAIFGPTDPARNGPYGSSMVVIRASEAATTYKRRTEVDQSMRAISPKQVWAALEPQLRSSCGGEQSRAEDV